MNDELSAQDAIAEIKEGERQDVANLRQAELAGSNRSSVVAAADERLAELDGASGEEDIRRDVAGRPLHPWEVSSPREDSSED